MAILIEWFCDPRNFNRWKGGRGQTGENKEILFSEVVALLQQNGIDYRTKRDVRNRIQYIQTIFKEALEWKNNTESDIEAQMRSEGQTEEAIAQSIKGVLKRKCPFWDDLEELMLSRPGVTGADAVSNGDGGNIHDIFLPNTVQDLSEDVVDSQESLYSLSSFPLDSADDPSSTSQRSISMASTEKRLAKKVRYSMEAQLSDALLASNAATKEKIAIEAKKLTLEEQKMEEMLAIERQKLELEERKVKKDEMNMKMIFSKFLLENDFLTKEEIKKKLFSDDDF
ncbi:MAG: hypothetical protein EXX96DRAFT_607330 [Benjaminiella poitrasii]|nr:MAG: hypothetical protein EXX96DRAFT_607330 [Benjaminiella poitrasii]